MNRQLDKIACFFFTLLCEKAIVGDGNKQPSSRRPDTPGQYNVFGDDNEQARTLGYLGKNNVIKVGQN